RAIAKISAFFRGVDQTHRRRSETWRKDFQPDLGFFLSIPPQRVKTELGPVWLSELATVYIYTKNDPEVRTYPLICEEKGILVIQKKWFVRNTLLLLSVVLAGAVTYAQIT